MRDPNRIADVLREVEATWVKKPETTFADIISSAVESNPDEHLWNIEDDVLMECLQVFRAMILDVDVSEPRGDAIRRIVLQKLQALWSLHPDWRLGQLLCILCDSHHQQNKIEDIMDEQVLAALRKLLQDRPSTPHS